MNPIVAWYLNNVQVNTIESTMKELDFAFGKGNTFSALLSFTILVGLRILG
jgi:hypothetical protein